MVDQATSGAARRGRGDPKPLAGRVVVIVGADRADANNGAEAARGCAEAGAALVLVGRDRDALGALARELLESGARVAVMHADLDEASSRAALAAMVHELFDGGPASATGAAGPSAAGDGKG
jgi:NAD(P)-dependent dehydrogenase (short-subunit alcohol dehydrogenase family)